MASREDGDLKALIRKSIRSKRDNPPLKANDDSFIRVSGLAGLCAREEVLCSRDEVVREDNINASLMMIFEHGHGLHWDLQNRVLPQTGVLYGRWLCGACGTYHGGQDEWNVPLQHFEIKQARRPRRCLMCDTLLTSDNCLYQEQWIKDPKYRLAGHPDGFLRMNDMPGLGVLEVKSINPRGAWEVRNCAKLDHVVQAQCYMWMTGCRWGRVLYWDKGTNGMPGLIQHDIEYDEDHVEAIKALVVDIWEGVESGKLPDRICASADCKRAELCAVTETCFKEKAL